MSRAAIKPASHPNPDARLAQQGDAFAQYRLGRFYAQHAGPQAPESVTWYVKASDGLRRLAEDGDGEAMYVLGVMYAFGRGVAKDREQARLWLEQAVDQQVPEAHMVLARLDGHRSADSR
jgi:TPR repeat protein